MSVLSASAHSWLGMMLSSRCMQQPQPYACWLDTDHADRLCRIARQQNMLGQHAIHVAASDMHGNLPRSACCEQVLAQMCLWPDNKSICSLAGRTSTQDVALPYGGAVSFQAVQLAQLMKQLLLNLG